MGLACLLRSTPVSRNKEVVWHQRQQLRRCSRVRRKSPRQGCHSRRRERQPRIASLQRPGKTLHHRRPARRLLLPLRSQEPHREGVPSRQVVFAAAYVMDTSSASTIRRFSLRDLLDRNRQIVSTCLAALLACIVLLPLLGHKPLTNWDE